MENKKKVIYGQFFTKEDVWLKEHVKEFILGKTLGDKTLAAVKVYARVDLDPVRNSMQQGMDKMLGFVKPDNI